MAYIVGVFKSRSEAEESTKRLRQAGVHDDAITLLTPQTQEPGKAVRQVDAEQPGMVKALGAVAGGAAGLGIGEGLATLIIPGVGPILAIGLIGGAILGALAGASVAGAQEEAIFSGIPRDELYIYKDALRQNRSVVIVAAQTQEEANELQVLLERGGAESINSARRMWWLGLRDVEKEHYNAAGGNFEKDESDFKRGFETALHDGSEMKERESRPDTWNSEAFRQGYERGRRYAESVEEEKQVSR